MLTEPLAPADARALLRRILEEGSVRFSSHALEEMAKDGIGEEDVRHVLAAGAVAPGEWENGSWRYRVTVRDVTAVATFRSELLAVVVTAWRKKRRR